jgi:hypothetical protein
LAIVGCGTNRRKSLLFATATVVVFCSGCGSTETAPGNTQSAIASPTPTTAPDCNVGLPGPPTIQSAFSDVLPQRFLVKEICASEVGPSLAGKDAAGLSDLAAAEVTDSSSSPDLVVLKALVGEAESGDASAFVDAFLLRMGETQNDTVMLDGRTVRYFNTLGGEGYAYAQGPTVVIGFISPTPPGVDQASRQEPAKALFTRVMAAATGRPIPVASNERVNGGIESYSPGRGRYTTPDDPGWVFFKTESIKGAPSEFCGIGPNGSIAGCDVVPAKDVPQGMNQTVVEAGSPARYVRSDTPTFTRDVDALLEGHRLDNGQASCGRGYQGTIQCVIGAHSFVVSSDYGVLE